MTIEYKMPPAEYFASHHLGSTSIRHLSDPDISLQEVQHLMTTEEWKPEYDVGTLAHGLILEGSLDHLIRRVDFEDYRTNAAKQARDMAYNDGRIPINNTEVGKMLDPVYEMRNAVMEHPIASELFTGHDPEVSFFWETDGVPMKARVDALKLDAGIAVDLKTLRSARPNDVRKQISDLGYYIQARHYLNGIKALTGFELDWYFVTVTKTPPYTVSVHRLSPNAFNHGQARIDFAMKRYKQAVETGWPGYTAVYEQDLTPWEAIKNDEMLELV